MKQANKNTSNKEKRIPSESKKWKEIYEFYEEAAAGDL